MYTYFRIYLSIYLSIYLCAYMYTCGAEREQRHGTEECGEDEGESVDGECASAHVLAADDPAVRVARCAPEARVPHRLACVGWAAGGEWAAGQWLGALRRVPPPETVPIALSRISVSQLSAVLL